MSRVKSVFVFAFSAQDFKKNLESATEKMGEEGYHVYQVDHRVTYRENDEEFRTLFTAVVSGERWESRGY